MKCSLIFLVASYKNTCKRKLGAAVAHTALGPSPPLTTANPPLHALATAVAHVDSLHPHLYDKTRPHQEEERPVLKCLRIPTHPPGATRARVPGPRRYFVSSRDLHCLETSGENQVESCLKKKKKDQECSRALWKPTKVGISDPSLSGSFLKTQALLRPHGARGQGDSQRHHNNSLALQMTAENSVFPLSHSRASLFLRISSLKAKKVSFPLSPFVFLGTV